MAQASRKLEEFKEEIRKRAGEEEEPLEERFEERNDPDTQVRALTMVFEVLKNLEECKAIPHGLKVLLDELVVNCIQSQNAEVGLFRVWCKIFDFFPKEFVIVKSKN
jgi:hypothetical protein